MHAAPENQPASAQLRKTAVLAVGSLVCLFCAFSADHVEAFPRLSSVQASEETADSQTDDEPANESEPQARKRAKWPKPVALVDSIEPLLEIEQTRNWAQSTLQLIDLLTSCDEISDLRNDAIFKQLAVKQVELERLSVLVSTSTGESPGHVQGELATELRRINYRISRRMAIWLPLYELAKQNKQSAHELLQESHRLKAAPVAHRRVYFDGIDPAWHDYLLIQETESILNSPTSTDENRASASRRLLARIHSPVLTNNQIEFIRSNFDEATFSFFKQLASEPTDFGRLLTIIELHEARESGKSKVLLNNDYQNLLWSSDPLEQHLAAIIDTHYRNANFRVTVSEKLINRLLPDLPETAEPVSENIMGARVFGQTYIQNQLRIGLIPDPDSIHLQLETLGRMDSTTTAHKSGFTVKNKGTSRFQVLKMLTIGRNGVFSDRAVAVSQSSQHLVGLRGKLDPIPVVGWLARKVAKQQIEAQKPATERYTRHKLERTAEHRMQEEVETQLTEMRKLVNENLIQPLVGLEMEPEPIQMATTQERIVMRYRLAGRDQMAANTSRPRALKDSLMSLQIHNSVVNNFLARIGLDEGEFTPLTLTHHLRRAMGLPRDNSKADEDAKIVFLPSEPIRVDFTESQIGIQLNLRSFQVGNGKTWRNLQIRTTYAPEVDGLNVVLNQAGSVHVKGPRLNLRDQIAIRAIFNNVFQEQYHFNPLPDNLAKPMKSPNLSITHLVIDNGWIGISLNDALPSQPGTVQYLGDRQAAPRR